MSIKLAIKFVPLLLCLVLTAPAAELPAHSLAEFGPITTPAQADAALAKAAQENAGLVIIPANAPAAWHPQNLSQSIWRKPEPPAQTKTWGVTKGITVLDYRDGSIRVLVPPISGLQFNSTPLDLGVTPDAAAAMITLHNDLIRGPVDAGGIAIDTFARTENQTFDVLAYHHEYSQGASAIYDGRVSYLGDSRSVIYRAQVQSEVEPFHGRVESWDPATQTLRVADAEHADTLASGRPILNLQPDKIITNGLLYVTGPGGAMLGWGGAIRSSNAPWTREVVGRYLAIDEPSEYVPGTQNVRRWWLITGMAEADGVKQLTVQRHMWGAKQVGSISRLYNYRDFTDDVSKPKLLRYIIASGANVMDAAGGRLLLPPSPHLNFVPGDRIEQAIGPDPFRPIVVRSWIWDSVPGLIPAPVLEAVNAGPVSRSAVMSVTGRTGFGSVISVEQLTENGIVFGAPIENAAILFRGPGRIQWNNYRSINVEPNGTLTLAATALDIAGQGVNANPNIRGLKIPVPAGKTNVVVEFAAPENSANYAAMARPSWPANHAVTEQTREGFTVVFDTPAPAGATIDWMIIR